jgi:hypothetical protein
MLSDPALKARSTTVHKSPRQKSDNCNRATTGKEELGQQQFTGGHSIDRNTTAGVLSVSCIGCMVLTVLKHHKGVALFNSMARHAMLRDCAGSLAPLAITKESSIKKQQLPKHQQRKGHTNTSALPPRTHQPQQY